jgi:uncharacterized protein (DUF58 family)
MTTRNHTIGVHGPRIQLEQLIQLRIAAKNIRGFAQNSARSSLGGGHRSTFRGRGMDFDEVRIYQPGDDIRSIDWRVTARSAKTHTKIFREEKERPVLLAVDQGNSMFFGSKITYKSVMATELAALLAWSTLQHQDRIGGIVFNRQQHAEVKPKRSKQALLGLLKIMADFNNRLFENYTSPEEFSLHQLLEKLRHMARPGNTIYLISDFYGYDQEAERLLYLIRRHTGIYALIVADSMEEQLPSQDQLSVTNGIHKISLDTSNTTIATEYRESFQKRQQTLESSFNKLGISHQKVWTHDDPCLSLRALLEGGNKHIRQSAKQNPHAI